MNKQQNAWLRCASLLTAGVGVSLLTFSAYAQPALTGTRIESAGSTSSLKVIQFEEPEEFIQIRRLLSEDNVAAALELATAYAARVEKNSKDIPSRYFARNALCVVYTHSREDAMAEQECTRAVELMPGHWSALNNRGTARYLAGNMAGARQDYQRALELPGNKKDVKELLEHNLALVGQ